jgi:hypothetical protein
MESAARAEGRTVIFVSHNMNAVQRLCARGIFLDRGKVACSGSASEIVRAYLSASSSQAGSSGSELDLTQANRFGTGDAQFSSVRYSSDLEAIGHQPYPDGPIDFSMSINANGALTLGSVAVTFYSLEGTKLVNADTISLGQMIQLGAGKNEVQLRIKQLHLNPGSYIVGLYLADPTGIVIDHVESAFEISVADVETKRLGQRPVQDGSVSCDFEVLSLNHHADQRADG